VELKAGQTAVVTGAASGMGRAFAERFGKLGMNVVLADIEEPRLVEVAGSMREDGSTVLPVVADVASESSFDELARTAFDTYGAVNVVCLNAGVGGGGPIAELGTKDWQWVLGVNLWGVIHGLRAFLPTMLASGEPGHIVSTASMAGMMAGPMMGPYNATKFAVVAIMETLRAELEMTGANVSCSVLCPGFVNTDIINSGRNRPKELAGYQGAPLEADNPMAEMIKQRFETATPPSRVAEIVEEGIRENRLHLFTDQEFKPIFEGRVQTILDAMSRY
jgi:NAD(P)-dependent dehydrogenase (short-subunit alcohol dehydrogenase family)